jgi:hypothetical protein
MSDDIVERLHFYIAANAAESGADVLLAEAADEIERLRVGRETMGNLWAREREARYSAEGEIERLKAALYRAKWEGEP